MTTEQDPIRFFIEKKKPSQADQSSRRNKRALQLFSGSALYGMFAALLIWLYDDGRVWLSMVLLYLYGMVGVIGIFYLNRAFSQSDKIRELLAEVLEKSPQPRAITAQNGETFYSNASFERLVQPIGLAPSLHAFTLLFSRPEDVERQLLDLTHNMSAGISAPMQLSFEQNGHTVWLQVSCQAIADTQYIHWRIDDITDRHEMESAIREEREKLRDFTDNAPVGFFSVDEEGIFRFANNTFLQMIGYEHAELIGKVKLADVTATPLKEGLAYDCLGTGTPSQFGDTGFKSKTGRVFKASVTRSISYREDLSLISRAIVYDLTEQQEMRAALRETQDRFERLFDEAPVGIAMTARDGKITGANDAFAEIVQQPRQDMIGSSLFDMIAQDTRQSVADWIGHIHDGAGVSAFIEVTLKGKVEVPVQIYARKMAAGDEIVLHFIDLTEHKNLEKQVTQSQKMQAIGQLAGGIAHDFNNLLTAMIGFCDLLLLKHKPGDPSFGDVMQIKQNANRAANLVRQLLAFSRQQTLQPRTLDITDVLSELSHLLRRLIGANIELHLHHAPDLGLIRADQGQMDQVLINLVVNARDAMPQGGVLNIRTQNVENSYDIRLTGGDMLPAGSWVAFMVEDSGTGIPPDILPRIFEPFFSTKDIGAGTGLGLATVHGIVHQTGGHIAVDSTVGKGTTFTIYLPRYVETAADKKQVAAEEKAAASDLTGSARILLVEDEDAVRTFSTRALSNKGYQVVDAAGGAQALKLMEEKKIDPEILITDVMMPEMDGTTLAKIVREKYPHVKIIFISGYAEDRFKEHLGGDVWFLPKPFTLKQLATKVKEVIDA